MSDSKALEKKEAENTMNLMREEKLRKELARQVAWEEAKQKAEKIREGKRKVVTIVEEIVDRKIDEPTLIERCKFLCKQDYEDVNVERSLVNICGYPLCFSSLPKPCKQRYHISLAEHKVYDLSERKLFCSNLCYKASCYLKEQLEEEPYWMRSTTVDQVPVNINIYCDTKGARGAEVLIVPRVEADDDDDNNEDGDSKDMKADVYNLGHSNTRRLDQVREESDKCDKRLTNRQQQAKLKSTFVASPYIKETDLTKFAESMSKLTIKEKIPSKASKTIDPS